MTLRANLERSVQLYTDKEAYTYLGKAHTYRELAGQVESLAGFLSTQGFKPGQAVALILPNSGEFLVAYYAITGLGGWVVPVNPLYTRDEISYILKDSQAIGVITTPQMAETMVEFLNPPYSLQWVMACGNEPVPGCLSWNEAFTGEKKLPEWPQLVDDDVAVILYTSGTTGKPKGAMLTHGNLCSNADALVRQYKSTHKDRFVIVLPMFHVFCMTICMNSSVAIGGALHILPKFSPVETVSVIRDWKATVFAGVPTMFSFILQTPSATAEDFASIRMTVSGGASIPVEMLRNFEQKFQTIILEGYGLSEASPGVCFNPVDGVRKPGSVGKPALGVEVKLVDEEGMEVTPNQVGELIVRGPNVMKGYLNNPEATQEALRNDWLYTGDMASQDEDGYYYIVDRKKDMINVGGYNVYPREVEEVLYQIPGVLEAAVVGLPDENYGEKVAAYVVPQDADLVPQAGRNLTAETVLEHCRQHLAKYKLPSEVNILTELPKNSTGKILRRVLRDN